MFIIFIYVKVKCNWFDCDKLLIVANQGYLHDVLTSKNLLINIAWSYRLCNLSLYCLLNCRKIIAKRKQHEYKLRRRIKTQQNYMDYIQYETNVLRLIGVRRKVGLDVCAKIILPIT